MRALIEKRGIQLALSFAFAGALGAVSGLLAAPGCTSAPCTSNDPNEPVPSLECPAGQLCYLGECIRSCTAGQERSATCTTDDDCDDARPNCIDGYCSSCEGFETCVPTLNLCREVTEPVYPEKPAAPVFPERPPFPLDGGAAELDGGIWQSAAGIKRIRDAGVTGPVEEPEVTVAGFFDVYDQVDLRSGAPVTTSGADVDVYDVSGTGRGIKWRADLTPLRIENRNLDEAFELAECTVRDVETATATGVRPQVDIGNMLVEDLVEGEDAIRGTLLAQFDEMQGAYVVQRQDVTTGPVLTYSETTPTFRTVFATISSPGTDLTDGAWPDWEVGEFRGFHVPFRLEPAAETSVLLGSPIVVSRPATQDLVFRWNYVQTGADNAEAVVVRVAGTRSELVCFDIEGNDGRGVVTVRAAVLDEFYCRELGVAAPCPQETATPTYDLYFERRSALSPLVVGDQTTMQLIDFSLRIRHSYLQTLRYQ